jgi:hypothetical protein
LPERGRLSRAFIEAWHDPEIIARDVVNDYQQVLRKKSSAIGASFHTA